MLSSEPKTSVINKNVTYKIQIILDKRCYGCYDNKKYHYKEKYIFYNW